MKCIGCFNDLIPFGIEPLTGESCGLGYRILCDVTEPGRRILAKLFGIPTLTLGEAWNRGTADQPHVGSILLTQEMVMPLAVFALLETGCSEAWLLEDKSVVGMEATD